MLHEILLSLSGQPSSLLGTDASQWRFPLLSPPEKALLGSVARLSHLHSQLRAHTSHISSSHPSTICRAVSACIATEHLGAFQNKILEVERAILLKDSAYVGGYGIVPLSTIVGEFAPWIRRLEWLRQVVDFMHSDSASGGRSAICSGAAAIDYLRRESQTGHRDLEEMALSLVQAAETAWMRQLSMWLLYGNIPTFGQDDFFIQINANKADDREDDLEKAGDFVMRIDLLPKFVSPATASSILFVGKSLNHLRGRRSDSRLNAPGSSMAQVTLQGNHISHLSSLSSPMSTSSLSNAVTEIRLSLSQIALSKLLPLPKILEILSLLHGFLLLGRGEFSMALVSHANSLLQRQYHTLESSRRPKSSSLDEVVIRDGEVMTALAKTWAEMHSLSNEEDPVDEELDLAYELLHLSVNNKKASRMMTPSRDVAGTNLLAEISRVSFDDLLFPTSTILSVRVPPPIDLFLATSDIGIYSTIHSYLLGIRRAQICLSGLWKRTSLRRSYPSPWGPPRSNTGVGGSRLRSQRQREKARMIQMRPIWAVTSASVFVLLEIGSYFQGEVVNGAWQHFRHWLEGTPSDSTASNSRPRTASSSDRRETSFFSVETVTAQSKWQPHDPETLTVAHRRYLSSIAQSLLLTEVPFTSALRSLLTTVDHLIALISRLEVVQRNLDLETDDGVVDALADYGREESELWQDLRDARDKVEIGIKEVVSRLRDIDDSRSGEGRRTFDLSSNQSQPSNASGAAADQNQLYVPRKAAGVDRLLMKLDFGSLDDGAHFQYPSFNEQNEA